MHNGRACGSVGSAGYREQRVSLVPDALELLNGGAVEHLDAYKKGLFHVQDLSSQLCCMALDPQPGDTVYDMCAAPGGKSFTLSELTECKGKILAMDVYPSRLALIEDGAERLGLQNISVIPNDASKVNPALKKRTECCATHPVRGSEYSAESPRYAIKPLKILTNCRFCSMISCVLLLNMSGSAAVWFIPLVR